MAASTPRPSGTDGGSAPPASGPPPRARIGADGSRPTNENRLHRSPCSTDSSRKPGRGPPHRATGATGVCGAGMPPSHTGTTVWSAASLRKSSLLGFSIELGAAERAEEAGVVAGVARPLAVLHHDEQQHVGVAVVVGTPHPLALA